MAREAANQQSSSESDDDVVSVKGPTSVKVTLHLKVTTAQRLGIESAMRRISQSAIAEEVLAAYLSRWELPSITGSNQRDVA